MPVVHKIIRGRGSDKWLPFARSKLERLAEECERARAPHRARRFVVDAGMVDIAVEVKGQQHYIKIARRTCPPFLSGLCDLVLHKEGDLIGADVPFTPIYQIDDPDSSDPADTIDVFRRFYPSPATPPEDRAWRDELRLARNHAAAKQMILLKASMFSGEMRKVVQVLQGMNAEIPYSPTYGVTHGVFAASGGGRWIIEISAQGIVAWPMRTCRNPITDAAGVELLDYHPIATPKPVDTAAAALAGTYVVLASAEDVLDCYIKSATHMNCGWAFSASGHKAANCVYTFVNWAARFFQYEIEISEADGKPVSAAITLAEEGWVSGPINGHPKFPLVGYTIASFDTRSGILANLECHAPVFCYFAGETLQVVHYHYTPGTEREVLNEQVPCGGGGFATLPSDDGRPYLTAGFDQISPQPHFTFDSLSTPHESHTYGGARFESRTRGGEVTAISKVFDGMNCQTVFTGAVNGLTEYTRVFEVYDGVEIVKAALILPPQDREALYLCSYTDRRAVERTSYNLRSGHHRQAYPSNGSLVLYEYTGTCCSAKPAQITITGPLDPGAQLTCDNGTWLYDDGFNTSAWEYYPAAIGGTVQVRDAVSCACISTGTAGNDCRPTHVSPAVTISQPDLHDGGSLDANVIFAAGAAIRRGLPFPTNVEDVFRFTENSPQFIVAIRDAFGDGVKYIIAPTVNRAFGVDMVTNIDYPVSEAGATYSFIGVPSWPSLS